MGASNTSNAGKAPFRPAAAPSRTSTMLTANGTLLTDPRSVPDVLLGLAGAGPRRAVSVNDRGYVVGQDHHRARLTDHDVWLIHELRAEGMRCRTIAAKFDVSVHTVHAISSGRRRSQTTMSQRA